LKTELHRKFCKACKQEIIQLPLTVEQKYYLHGAMKSDLKLFAANKLKSEFGLNKVEAESVLEHLNSPFGKCCNCEFDELKDENIECPNCGKLNYNLSDPYVSKEFSEHPEWCLTFCSLLEWSLKFNELKNESVHHFWCDGITEFSTKEALENGQVTTKAWIGHDGQGDYQMTIIFGQKFIETLRSGGNMIECIPNEDANTWVEIEPELNRITVKLK